MVATIRDVARLANVSVSTTSRALNGRDDVSPEVRQRVLEAAGALKYTANLHARALKGATARTIGVLVADTSAFSFNAPLLSGIYDAATPRGYAVIVCNASASPTAVRDAHDMFVEKRVDGLLLNSVRDGPGPLLALQAAGIPFVLLNRHIDEPECDSIALDYRRDTYLAARHLLERGHRRILHQLGSRDHPPSQDRFPGYRDALHEFDVPFDPGLVLFCDTMAEVHQHVREAFERTPRPTAVMAYNDENALPILLALRELDLRVPEDVAVVGHNNLAIAQYLDPPLTSVAHAVRDMARQATELLFEKIAWPAQQEAWTPRNVSYQPRLVVRQSSGTAALLTRSA